MAQGLRDEISDKEASGKQKVSNVVQTKVKRTRKRHLTRRKKPRSKKAATSQKMQQSKTLIRWNAEVQ